MTRKQWAIRWPLEKAFAEGKDVEYLHEDGTWRVNHDPDFNPFLTWRIKPELKIRPFKPEEVPVGALYKSKYLPLSRLIIACDLNGFVLLGGDVSIHVDKSEGQYSLDHGKTWAPFGVVE